MYKVSHMSSSYLLSVNANVFDHGDNNVSFDQRTPDILIIIISPL